MNTNKKSKITNAIAKEERSLHEPSAAARPQLGTHTLGIDTAKQVKSSLGLTIAGAKQKSNLERKMR
jgi:hypothetical protein